MVAEIGQAGEPARRVLTLAAVGAFACAGAPSTADTPPMPDTIDELTMQLGDSDPALRYAGALALCSAGWGNYAGQRPFLEEMGWAHATWGGLDEYTHGTAQILTSQDFFCDVSDTQVDQAEALDLLFFVLDAAGHVAWRLGETAMGCPELTGPLGGIVVQSAGQDPVCTPTGNSAVRFWMAGEDDT